MITSLSVICSSTNFSFRTSLHSVQVYVFFRLLSSFDVLMQMRFLLRKPGAGKEDHKGHKFKKQRHVTHVLSALINTRVLGSKQGQIWEISAGMISVILNKGHIPRIIEWVHCTFLVSYSMVTIRFITMRATYSDSSYKFPSVELLSFNILNHPLLISW